MDLFSGFRWPVPIAFSESLAKARFVEGDLFYDDRAAYLEEWRSARPKVTHVIQVRYPFKASTGASSLASKEGLSKNWGSEVRVDLYINHQRTQPGQIRTTQGRLYATLWKGSVDHLFSERTLAPAVPTGLRHATKAIDEVRAAALLAADGRSAFVMATDRSNSVSRDKFHRVLTVLATHMSQRPIVFSVMDAGFHDAVTYAPTVEVAVFPTVDLDKSELLHLVKAAVYARAPGTQREMFKIGAHGMII